jgi:tripartite-type tricarboxylate transporter receptor subunit TctC
MKTTSILTTRRRLLGALPAVLPAAWLASPTARAGETVRLSGPVNIIVPYPPGGQGDVFARLISTRLGAVLEQPVIVDNRPGGTGALGARLAARARPDGNNLLMGQTGEMAVNMSVVKSLGYNPLTDFRPVVLIGDSPLVLVVPASAPYSDLAGLLAAAKARPEGLDFASSGTATPGHIAGASLALASHTRLVHIPYKGAGQAMSDVLAGQVQMFFSSASAVVPYVQSGKLKALAVCSARRISALPKVPTMAEAGFPRLAFSLWAGLFAPAGTPENIVEHLNRVVGDIVAEPAIRQRLEAEGSAVPRNTPREFADFVRRDVARYAEIIQETGIKAE